MITGKKITVASIVGFAALAVSAQSLAATEYKKVRRLGTSQSICKPPIQTAEDLQAFFRNQPEDVREILAAAGWEGNAQDLFAAIEAGEFTDSSFGAGTRMEWMGIRNPGGIVAQPREWAGAEPFPAFEMNVTSNCKTHRLIIPKACCNLSLLSDAPVEVAAPRLGIIQGEGDQVTINVAAAEGTNATLELTHPDGTVEQLPLDANGSWTGAVAPGEWQVTAKADNDCGGAAAIGAISMAAPMVVAPVATGFFLAPFIGRQVRNIDPPLVGVDLGYLKPIGERTDWFAQAGASYNTDSEVTSVYVDTGIDQHIGETGFIGAGVGIWDINNSESKDETIFIHGGADLPYEIGGHDTQWFVEGRVFENHTDDISNHNILKAGIRILY